MASTSRTGTHETSEPTTSGSERPARAATDRGDGWWRERVIGVVNARKSRVSDSLETVAETVKRAGEPLHDEPFSKLGAYADVAAGAIERVAVGLRERDVDELAEDVRGFARSRPALFLGAGLVAGLAAGRFLRSSSEAVPRTSGAGAGAAAATAATTRAGQTPRSASGRERARVTGEGRARGTTTRRA
jgi:hypothetical protein